MVRNPLVIEVLGASDKRMVTIRLRPIDSCFLSCESAEDMVRVVFDHIIVNGRSFRAALRTRFYVNARHSYFLRRQTYRNRAMRKLSFSKSVDWEKHVLSLR